MSKLTYSQGGCLEKVLTFLAFVFCLYAPIAKSQDELPSAGQRRVIGENNLEPIEETLGTNDYHWSKVVARIERENKASHCSAFKVGTSLFLTNYHCLIGGSCADFLIHQGAERGLPEKHHTHYSCIEVLAKSQTNDYALLRVKAVEPSPLDPTPGEKTHRFDFDHPIPDNDPKGLIRAVNVKQDGTVSKLKVGLRIEHTWIGDLVIKLTSPSGTVITLQDRQGAGSDNIDKVFVNNTGAMQGESAAGTWLLSIVDSQSKDTGSLKTLSLIISTESAFLAEIAGQALAPKSGACESLESASLYVGDLNVGMKVLAPSHPLGRDKEIDRSDSCELVAVDPVTRSSRKTIVHTCDTEFGSSGSPLIDRATGSVVAIHWGGVDTENYAIPMSQIVDHLEKNIPADILSELTLSH